MMASLRIIVLALFALSITTVAFADPMPPDAAMSDAESDAAESDASDVGPVFDVTESDVTESDVTESDVVEPEPDATEPPSGQFSESECWDEMCPEQINACKADANCSSYAGCIVNSANDTALETCLTELQTALGEEVFAAASDLYQKIGLDCGWAACATTEGTCAGNCGNYNGSDVCNCDEQCWSFGDCCQDICDVCAAENADECGTACVPACDGKSCGPDGCGGSCGACTPGESCGEDGTCGSSCTNECEDGEVGCDGDSAWICGMNSLGCTAYSTTDCAGSGQVCSEGMCVDSRADGDAAAAGDSDATFDASAPDATGVGPVSDGVVSDVVEPGPDTTDGTGVATSVESDYSSSASGCGGAPSDGGPLSGLIASLLVLGLAIRRRA